MNLKRQPIPGGHDRVIAENGALLGHIYGSDERPAIAGYFAPLPEYSRHALCVDVCDALDLPGYVPAGPVVPDEVWDMLGMAEDDES